MNQFDEFEKLRDHFIACVELLELSEREREKVISLHLTFVTKHISAALQQAEKIKVSDGCDIG